MIAAVVATCGRERLSPRWLVRTDPDSAYSCTIIAGQRADMVDTELQPDRDC
jgi:hypothetical protein